MVVSLPLWIGGFVVLLGTVTDLMERRIPNWITLPAIAGGFLFHGTMSGWTTGSLTALGGLLVGGGLLLPFFLLGKMGGGDVKLLAALGAWHGGVDVLNLFIFSALTGVLWALWIIFRSQTPLSIPTAVRRQLVAMCTTGAICTTARCADSPKSGMTMPYAVAFVSGYVLFIVCGRLV